MPAIHLDKISTKAPKKHDKEKIKAKTVQLIEELDDLQKQVKFELDSLDKDLNDILTKNEKLIETIKANNVCVIVGETGSGEFFFIFFTMILIFMNK